MQITPIALAAISSVAALHDAVWEERPCIDAFAVTCTVTAATGVNNSCWVMDDTGCAYLRSTNSISLNAGDIVVASGHIGRDKYNWRRAFLESAVRIGKGRAPEPLAVTPEQLCDESLDGRTVAMQGIVADIIHDEIDPDWRFLMMRSQGGNFFAAIPAWTNGNDAARLLGATISARGVANVLPDSGRRKFQTPQLTLTDFADITVVSPAPQVPDEAPQIPLDAQSTVEGLRYKSVSALSRMGMRSAHGVVIASFDDGRRLLVKNASGQIIGAELRERASLRYGESVAVAGFPETDLFIITLTKAMAATLATPLPSETSRPIPLPDAFPMEKVLRDICAKGDAVQVRGRVLEAQGCVCTLLHGEHTITVDCSSVGPCLDFDILPGSVVEMSGTCVRNTYRAVASGAFPRTAGFTLVPRFPHDVRLVSAPPWWTAGRLALVIALLLTALAAVIARGSRKRRIAELRVEERTRLAVELHDSIAQTLTGVSFQVDAAAETLPGGADAAARFLGVARRTLASCREELRRCLWDLRSETLAERDMQDAVEKTIRPHLGEAQARVRFHVRRSLMPDVTAHNVLCIIRELCVNAVRDGHARNIRIAGEARGGALRFHVRDDGSGFDPASCPGLADGHFGLTGIRERLRRLRGSFCIESQPGKGTKATVEIRL